MQEGQQPNEPGWVFKPGDKPTQEVEVPIQQSPPVTVTPPVRQPAPEASIVPQPAVEEPAQPAASPVETYEETASEIEWTASEYIANPKSGGWYVLLGVCSMVLATIAYFVTGGDLVSTVVIAILGIIVGVFAARQPRTLDYAVNSTGLKVGNKFYPYSMFKSFSVAHEQAIGFISLLPLKRFMPPLVIHYAPDDENRIATTLADYLPYEDHKVDVVDNITRRIRF